MPTSDGHYWMNTGTTWGDNTYYPSYPQTVYGSGASYPVTITGVATVTAPPPPAPEGPLDWLERRVDEICDLVAA